MASPSRRWGGRAALASLLLLPISAALASPLQQGRDISWVLGGLAGILALGLLVVQMLLPTNWLRGLFAIGDMRLHRVLGIAVAGVVIAHVLGLYVYSPDDVRDALVLAAPTYSRLGVLSAWCVLLSVVLALARRRLGLTYSDWQILHAVLAVVVVATAVGHTVLIRGALDGPAELLLCGAAVLAVTAAILYRYVVLPRRTAALHSRP